MVNNNYNRKSVPKKTFASILSLAFAVLLIACPLMGCESLFPKFCHFAAVWVYESDDIKISFTSTGISTDILKGRLCYNDVEYSFLFPVFTISNYGKIYDAEKISIDHFLPDGQPSTAEELFEDAQKEAEAFLLAVNFDGYKTSVKFTIQKDNISGDESLVGRELVLLRKQIPIPTDDPLNNGTRNRLYEKKF